MPGQAKRIHSRGQSLARLAPFRHAAGGLPARARPSRGAPGGRLRSGARLTAGLGRHVRLAPRQPGVRRRAGQAPRHVQAAPRLGQAAFDRLPVDHPPGNALGHWRRGNRLHARGSRRSLGDLALRCLGSKFLAPGATAGAEGAVNNVWSLTTQPPSILAPARNAIRV